jgi:hypothetical protein
VISLNYTVSRPALGTTQPSTQWVPVVFSSDVKRTGREAVFSEFFKFMASIFDKTVLSMCPSRAIKCKSEWR